MYCGIYSFKYKLLADSFESISTTVSPISTLTSLPAMLTSKKSFHSVVPLTKPLSSATISSILYFGVFPSSGACPVINCNSKSSYSSCVMLLASNWSFKSSIFCLYSKGLLTPKTCNSPSDNSGLSRTYSNFCCQSDLLDAIPRIALWSSLRFSLFCKKFIFSCKAEVGLTVLASVKASVDGINPLCIN